MKSAPGRAGIAIAPWPCLPMQCSSSCGLRPSRSGKKGPCRAGGQTECGRTAPPAASPARLGGATGAAAVVVALSSTASGGRTTRPCPPSRPASSTRPTAAAAAPARAELTGVDASPLGRDLPAAAAVPAGASGERSPTYAGRDPVGHAHWWFLARLARPVWCMVHGSTM
jgi:hypothetical protein